MMTVCDNLSCVRIHTQVLPIFTHILAILYLVYDTNTYFTGALIVCLYDSICTQSDPYFLHMNAHITLQGTFSFCSN